jgi:exodeoxyribonuclease VII large subunit
MADSVVYAVAELTELIKRSLEESFSYIAVEGEISNWRPAPSGHAYFTLKDGGAMLQAVMFKGKGQRLAFAPKDGMLVRASGGLSVYAARGQYQLIVDSMALAGAGDILALLEERKRRLAAEGLFDQDRKRPIPAFPSRVAVISSPTGAAIRDILNVLKRRNAGLRITLLPSLVQGDDAPDMLVRQLRIANEQRLGEVIIIGRGGGSLEDLLAFSDEALVRAVAASGIPVISAVGHEIDWCLCDFAADLRAPTPSAAAELVSESSSAVRSRVAEAAYGLERAMRGRLDRARLVIRGFAPDALEMRLERTLQPSRQRFDDAKEDLVRGIRDALRSSRYRLDRGYSLLCAADPEALLARGYAVVRKEGVGRAIRRADELEPNDRIAIRFARGSARAIAQEIQP